MNETEKKEGIKEKIITAVLSILTGGIYLALKMAKDSHEKNKS
ncbi:MAG: hypothetical protein OIF32_01770 [Campylobacterales bacterium]|nr:hypothetical protein [Campylobacterales bacterium]